MEPTKLVTVLTKIANEYPEEIVASEIRDIPRMVFNISVVLDATRHINSDELAICDIGGGVGLFSVGCAAYGFKRTVLIDDFNDTVNQRIGDSVFSVHKKYGVEVISCDVIANGLESVTEKFDVITTFDSMEHWHNSPKRMFQEVIERLKPGGIFILGVPNCANLRKRITLPFGIGKWSSMEDWYESEQFRGHVREPDISDLKYIARDMNLSDVRIQGRNWLGYYSQNPIIRIATKIIDFPLRLKPSLCSDIYMVGKKSLR